MSISAVARSQNFTRPEIVTGSKKLAIVNGRHPLVVDCDFVTNTTRLEGEERVVMVTGPNASGKSVYLKQVQINYFIL
jgi:DNA mismatch repair ATPase MutS